MVRVRRAAKKGGGAKKERGCEKKGGARSTGTPPVYAPGLFLMVAWGWIRGCGEGEEDGEVGQRSGPSV